MQIKKSLIYILSINILMVCAVPAAHASSVGFFLRYDNLFGQFLFQNTSVPGTADIVSLSLDLSSATSSAAASSSGNASTNLRFDTLGSPSLDFRTDTGASLIPTILYPPATDTDGEQTAAIEFGTEGFDPGDELRFSVDIDSYTSGSPNNDRVGLEGLMLAVRFDNGQLLSASTIADPAGPNRFFVAEVTAPLSNVPVPAAIWLFGSGLLGLAAIARTNKAS